MSIGLGTITRTQIGDNMTQHDSPSIGIEGRLAAPPLPHHQAYGSVPWRFRSVEYLTSIQSRQSSVIKILNRKRPLYPGRMTNPPRAFGTPRRLQRKLFGNSQSLQFGFASTVRFPLTPLGTTKPAPHPAVQITQYRGCFCKTKVTTPATKIPRETIYPLVHTDSPVTVRQLAYLRFKS